MRAIVQRVSSASIRVGDKVVGAIGRGLLVYLGVHKEDTESDADYLMKKIISLRIFEDENDKMNLSIKDVSGEILLVSQFTLFGDARKGRRPSFTDAAEPQKGEKLYTYSIESLKNQNIIVAQGKFGAHMIVESINDGPVTIMLDSTKLF